jgi:hypothetical protein
VIRDRVAGEWQHPGGEADALVLVLADRRHQLGEHNLHDVLGLTAVVDKALHVADHVGPVTDIEEMKAFGVPLLGEGDC